VEKQNKTGRQQNSRQQKNGQQNNNRQQNRTEKQGKAERARRSQNRQILTVTYIFILMFCALIGYYIYFLVAKSEEAVNNPYNVARINNRAERIYRGKILSDTGEPLAMVQVGTDGEASRYYPYGSVFAHTVGYSTRGTVGLEALFNRQLLTCSIHPLNQVYNELTGTKNSGDNVNTTLNLELQQVLYDAMAGYEGAAVALEPSTGKVLAMVSKPDFDPNQINEIYDELIADPSNTNLLNKAAQGLYSPGSVFKLFTLLEYMKEKPYSWKDFSYDCHGTIRAGGASIDCSGGTAHGRVDVERALELSCNGAFIKMGLELDTDQYRETCELAGFNQNLDFQLSYKSSRFSLTDNDSVFTKAQTAFGQGETLVTPLHMAMVVSAIANNGMMMTPYLVSGISDAEGTAVEQYQSPSSLQIMTAEQANAITFMMEGVVNNGTASIVRSDKYQAAAKTGSAEIGRDMDTHAWFVGFAPSDQPAVAVAVVLEKAGSGGNNAGPVAKKIFDAYLAD